MNAERLVKRKQRAKRDGNVRQLAEILKELGDSYFEAGRFDEALQEYAEQIEICEVMGNKLDCAVAHRMIGEVHAAMGNYQEALIHQNQHLEGARELENTLEEQRAFATLGRTYFCFAESLTDKFEEKENALNNAKKAFGKSIRLCNKLKGTIREEELHTMHARLLLNLGLVREAQKAPEEGLEKMKLAEGICREYNLTEDLHRTNIALGAFQERQSQYEIALDYYGKAANVNNSAMKADAYLAKAELLLKLGEWLEARKPLVNLYTMKNLSADIRKQTEKLLRIAVTICNAEDNLLTETDSRKKQDLYENLGDAAVEVRSYEKAIDYYGKMLMYAEESRSDKVGAALISLAQTLRDVGRDVEALPYVQRELKLCSDPREACRSALQLAEFMISAGSKDFDIRDTFNLALSYAKETKETKLEISVLREFFDYLERVVDIEEMEKIKSRINELEKIILVESDEEDEPRSQKIGEDICLDDLSDVEEALNKSESVQKPKKTPKRGFVLKRNEKGETQLQVACIKGDIETVEKLLEKGHPVNVRDSFGWTPLHEVANYNFVEIAKLLIKAGAEVNDPGGPDCGAVTPLLDAACNGNFSMIHLLLENGANVNAISDEGDTAVDCLESWKNRVGEDLSRDDKIEYQHVHAKLLDLMTVSPRYRRRSIPSRRKKDVWVDEEEPEKEVTDEVRETKKKERISAGEDYKRTIANLKNRGGLLGSSSRDSSSRHQKVTAPLLDSEEVLVGDWLEVDVIVPEEKRISCEMPRNTTGSSSSVRRNSSVDSSATIKRKSSNGPQEAEKDSKRQRKLSVDADTSVDFDANSHDSMESNESMFSEFPRRKKKTKQVSLLKSGFTKERNSRSPSPIYSIPLDHVREQTFPSTVLNFSVLVDYDVYNVTITCSINSKNVLENVLDEVKNKFEKETGCKAKLRLKTWKGVELSPESTPDLFIGNEDPIKLIGEIIDIHTPSIVARYEVLSKDCNAIVQESTVKSLKVCENTTIFRLNAKEMRDEELLPLMKSLQYHRSLQALHLSRGILFDQGKLLNVTIQRLPCLYELHLQNCDIDFEVLSQLDKFPQQLRILNLSYNPLGSESQEKLYNLLQPLKNLQSLSLRYCRLEEFRFTLTNDTLEKLDVSWNAVGGEGISQLLQRQMIGLTLSNTQSPCSLNVVSKIINNPNYSLFALETLELAFSKITDADVRRILSETPNLTRLVLAGNKDVTKISVYALLKKDPSLFHIDVGGCSEIVDVPPTDLRVAQPEVCTCIVSMTKSVIYAWKDIWRGKGRACELPHNVVIFKPL